MKLADASHYLERLWYARRQEAYDPRPDDIFWEWYRYARGIPDRSCSGRVTDVGTAAMTQLRWFVRRGDREKVHPLTARAMERRVQARFQRLFVARGLRIETGEPPDDVPVTYLIGSPATGLVKIGKTRSYRQRLGDLQMASGEELYLVGWFAGNVEKSLHRAMARFRIRGEWFDFYRWKVWRGALEGTVRAQ